MMIPPSCSLVGTCMRCGQGCRAIKVKVREEAVRQHAREDGDRGLSILKSDALFLERHCTHLTLEEAFMRSPAIIQNQNWTEKEYWACEFHREDGLCSLDILNLPKPHICMGYPWYGRGPFDAWLYPGCGYHVDLLGIKINRKINKEEKVMSVWDEMEVNVAEVVDYTKLNGSFATALREVVKRKLSVEEAKRRGLSVSDEELQKAADTFRRVNNLITSDATDTWFKENGISLDALENYLESNILIYELKNQLLNECDKEKYVASSKVQDSIREMAYQEWMAKVVG